DTSSLGSVEACDVIIEDSSISQCLQIGDRAYFITGSKAAAVSGIGLVASFAYHVVLQGLTGATLGKLVTGIRTVREEGTPPGIGKAALRWVLLLVDGFPYFVPLVGFVCALTSSGHRRVGDMAAKTFVVSKAAVGRPVGVPGLTPASPYATGWGQPAAGSWGQPPTGPAGPSGWDAPGTAWGQGGTAPGWGSQPPTAPADPSTPGWAAPSDQPPAAQAPPAQAPPPAAPAPQWDEARGTYIQWDPAQAKWLQWDEARRTWDVIPGQ
ncbi:MAG: RDD family protein, partial [Acidimicrobiia bacterium]